MALGRHGASWRGKASPSQNQARGIRENEWKHIVFLRKRPRKTHYQDSGPGAGRCLPTLRGGLPCNLPPLGIRTLFLMSCGPRNRSLGYLKGAFGVSGGWLWDVMGRHGEARRLRAKTKRGESGQMVKNTLCFKQNGAESTAISILDLRPGGVYPP